MKSKIRTIVNEASDTFDGLGEWIMEPALDLSKLYPDGEKAFFDRRIFEFISDWQKKSTLAAVWIKAGLKFNLQENEGIEWLEKFCKVYTEFRDEENTILELQEFMPMYFELWQLVKFRDESTRQPGTGEVELTLRQIALVCYYTGQQITPSNANKILKAYRPKLASGDKLMDRYREVIIKANRINLVENRRTDLKRLKDLAAVIEYLQTIQSDTKRAEMEYSILESAIKETE